MDPVMRILSQVVVKKFYERNSGFFLFVFFLMFGIVESTQIVNYHLSLIYGAITSPVFFLIISVLWSFYMTKCFAFVVEIRTLAENSFLMQLGQLKKSRQFLFLLVTFLLLYLPVEIYSMVIVSVAVHGQYYFMASLIVLVHFTLLMVATWVTVKNINSTKAQFSLLPSLKWPWPKPLPFIYLNALTSDHKIILLLTKAFSFFALIGFMHIPLDHYEPRIAMMGLLFGLAAHAVIVFEFRKLEDHHLMFVRQLPLSIHKRFLLLVSVYALVLLPELILIVVNPIHLVDAAICFLAGCSFLLFSHCTLYKNDLNMDKHMQVILYLFLVGFGVALFNLTFPASLLLMLAVFHRFQKHYYQHEASGAL